ncbi:MAG: hypothetical protein LC720_06075 [Actinobacteria bacterium]|nr:hypothetical protein [Actinomycetota bacterium]
MSNFLEQKRNEIGDRLRELAPLVEEYHQLEAAASALAGVTPERPTPKAKPPARRPARTRARAASTATATAAAAGNANGKRRGRPPGSGTRARQALELVGTRPGITIPEMASEMGIKQNYLYRVLPTLEKDGKVIKRERGWHAAAPTAEPTAG